MTERGGAIIILLDFIAPNASPTILKCFTILMTEMTEAIIFVGFWRPPPPPPQCPPPLTPQYLTISMTERGRALPLVGFWRLPMPMMSQYLTILLTERRGAIIFCRILAPLNAPPPRRHNT